MVMLPCPGATPDEAVLDPYVYAGQHAGSSISGWLLSLSTLMMLGGCLAKARRNGGIWLLLSIWSIFCLGSFVLQAVAHSFIPAAEYMPLLRTARVLLALGAAAFLAIGTGVGESWLPDRKNWKILWALVWLMTIALTAGFVAVTFLASDDDGDLAMAAVMSLALFWAAGIWIVAALKKRLQDGTNAGDWFIQRIVATLLLAGAFWLFPLFEPTCGIRGHFECYKSCPVGPGLPYLFFIPFWWICNFALAAAQDKSFPDEPKCWLLAKINCKGADGDDEGP